MPDPQLNEIYKTLGSLEQAVSSLARSVENAERIREQDRRNSAEYRKQVYQTLQVINERLAQIPDMQRRLGAVEQTALEWQAIKNRGIGMVFGLFLLGSIGGTTATLFTRKILGAP